MTTEREQPDFSFIRSESERSHAQRSYEIGCDLADAIVDVGDIVRRAVDRVSLTFARKPISNY